MPGGYSGTLFGLPSWAARCRNGDNNSTHRGSEQPTCSLSFGGNSSEKCLYLSIKTQTGYRQRSEFLSFQLTRFQLSRKHTGRFTPRTGIEKYGKTVKRQRHCLRFPILPYRHMIRGPSHACPPLPVHNISTRKRSTTKKGESHAVVRHQKVHDRTKYCESHGRDD